MAKTMSKETNDKIDNIVASMNTQATEGGESKQEGVAPKAEVKEDQKQEDHKIQVEEEQEHSASDESLHSVNKEYEHEARLRGWKPKEEYDGDKSKWRNAEEFLEVGKIYDQQQSKKLERELNEIKEEMRFVRDINVKQAERLAQEKVDYLRAAKSEAIQAGNIEQVDIIDTQLNIVNKEVDSYKTENSRPKFDSRLVSFKERNKDWFNSETIDNMQLVNHAIEYEKMLGNTRPELTIDQRLDLTEKAIRSSQSYLSTHVNKNRERPSDVTINAPENSSFRKSNKKRTFNDLPFKSQQYINNIYKAAPQLSKSLSKDEYAQQLFESGELNNE
jgi:hypothetical protein